ncbi:MAG TPA: tRNA adenosine deaminase-associated protein [Candidatus Nanopelagicaceae bacterium]|nr:tRNA adenosine deaminase-associated protein [Candidatus Nanopelagicaceae bacterium]
MTQSVISPADFAIAAWHEDGRWQVVALPLSIANDLSSLVDVLQAQPTNGGATALLSVSEDFFILIRVLGHDVRLVLSDVTAATEWALAGQVLEQLGMPMPDEDDEQQPAGDLSIFADLGLEPMELGAICDDLELYPDEQLEAIAHRLGFGDEFSEALDTVAD